MNVDGGFDGVDGLANVGSWILARGFLNEEVARGAFALFSDDANAPSRRVEVDLLQNKKQTQITISVTRLNDLVPFGHFVDDPGAFSKAPLGQFLKLAQNPHFQYSKWFTIPQIWQFLNHYHEISGNFHLF